MRLSTNLIFDRGAASISERQSELFKTQQQMSTGRRLLTPADDPVAATLALRSQQGLSLTQQQAANQDAATATLNRTEAATAAIGDLLQEARQVLVSAGNGGLSDGDRRSLATVLSGHLQQLASLANARDGAGGYLFAGFNDTAAPFALTSTGAVYAGDDGVRELDVAPQRRLPVTASGADLLMRIPSGNGVYAVAAGAANSGTGLIDPGRVVSPAALTGHQYQLVFTSAAAYDVLDVTAGTTVSSGNAYTPSAAISVAGMQTTVSGAPVAGDTFALDPSRHQSVFSTFAKVISALNTPVSTPALATALANQMNHSLTDLDRAFDSVLTARTGAGARLAELETLKNVTNAASDEHQRRLSELQDLDYARAASDLTRQQTLLQANQQSFAKIAKLSLFDYLG